MKTVFERVRKLETRFGSTTEAMREPAGPSAAEVIGARLAALGIVRGPNESLAETTARAMGLSVREFRAELQRRAAGFTARPKPLHRLLRRQGREPAKREAVGKAS